MTERDELYARMTALSERLAHYWMREYGTWAEYDKLAFEFRTLKARYEKLSEAAER